MKKGGIVLLLIFTLFIGILIGMPIGRSMDTSYVLSAEEQPLTEPPVSSTGTVTPTETGSGKIDINTASISLLKTLPSIGDVLAQRIIDYRTENGAYSVVEDLLMVDGIGSKRLEQIRPYITVGG